MNELVFDGYLSAYELIHWIDGHVNGRNEFLPKKLPYNFVTIMHTQMYTFCIVFVHKILQFCTQSVSSKDEIPKQRWEWLRGIVLIYAWLLTRRVGYIIFFFTTLLLRLRRRFTTSLPNCYHAHYAFPTFTMVQKGQKLPECTNGCLTAKGHPRRHFQNHCPSVRKEVINQMDITGISLFD